MARTIEEALLQKASRIIRRIVATALLSFSNRIATKELSENAQITLKGDHQMISHSRLLKLMKVPRVESPNVPHPVNIRVVHLTSRFRLIHMESYRVICNVATWTPCLATWFPAAHTAGKFCAEEMYLPRKIPLSTAHAASAPVHTFLPCLEAATGCA